ncbi:MAG TPA: sensor histidine kinase [Polyangiaceae bacterium]|nr:sensor histidine kinase [Polyangiaceae bacterium]
MGDGIDDGTKGTEAASPEAARATDKLSQAHARFASAALWIYFGAALIALSLLLAAVLTDKAHNDEQSEAQFLLETEVLAHRLNDHLTLVVDELTRIGLRAEIDLSDADLGPERALLDAHQDSPLFGLGASVLDESGNVLFANPPEFMAERKNFGARPWFLDVHDHRVTRIVAPTGTESVLYVVSPIVRGRKFMGALVGGIDLTEERSMTATVRSRPYARTFLATTRGSVVYPPSPPGFTKSADWYSVFQRKVDTSTMDVVLDAQPSVVAAAPLPLGDLVFVNTAKASDLFRASDERLWTRLLLGVALALVPMLAIVVALRWSLAQFRRSETEAVREEHLRTIGEAANVIAHEVRNSLNGIRMGVELVMDRKQPASERVVTELKAEIERLVTFTHQLMLFAKNPVPSETRVNLSETVPSWLALTRDVAAESGANLVLSGADEPVLVRGDPTLLRMIVGNLVSNALDAVAGVDPPEITVEVGAHGNVAEVRVRDNGPGVPEDFRGRLFSPFVSGKPSGVGMGLSISRKIARAHGGDLVLENTRSGASFLLTLPLESA